MNLSISEIHSLVICKDTYKSRMQKLAQNQLYGVILTDINLHDHFNNINFPHYQLHFTKEALVRMRAYFYYSKNSVVLRRRFNKIILLLQSHGLIDRYQRQYRGMRRDSKQKDVKQLRLGRISPIFRICGILCAISFLVFLVELYAYNWPLFRRILEYLTY